MNRGDLVLVVSPGDYGKPRPAVVVQTDLLNETHASLAVCLLTTHAVDAPLFRLDIEPTPQNGLQAKSQIMVDKIVSLKRERVKEVMGRLDERSLICLNRSLAFVLGLG
jgi:mRNA interferase MazF